MRYVVSLVAWCAASVAMADGAIDSDARARAMLRGSWQIVSIKTDRPVPDGQELPEVGQVLKFHGVGPPAAPS